MPVALKSKMDFKENVAWHGRLFQREYLDVNFIVWDKARKVPRRAL